TQFQNTYSGFTQATKFSTAYKNWSKTTMDSIKGSLAAANLQANQFSTEEGTLSALRSMSQSSGGQLQALQTGTQIAVEQASQLQKLRGLMMAQMQAQNAYMAGNQQDKDNRKAAEENFFVPSSGTNGKSYKSF
ncbi:MAG: P-type conjugative transfer protein TrbJ, partial [Ralstonia sp.]|nr:P-type conjugative transfer protein TrbJ [Ralstonia sp.]